MDFPEVECTVTAVALVVELAAVVHFLEEAHKQLRTIFQVDPTVDIHAGSFSHPAPGLGHGYYGGRYYGYPTYGFRSWYNPYFGYGAFAGAFWGGVVIGGLFNPFWWPYYAIPTQPGYYDSYPDYYTYQQDPQYVIAVPPAEATNAYQQQEPYQQQGAAPPVNMPPDQCYGPKVDANGNVIKDNGNMVPDFSKPVPCPPRQ